MANSEKFYHGHQPSFHSKENKRKINYLVVTSGTAIPMSIYFWAMGETLMFVAGLGLASIACLRAAWIMLHPDN